MGKFVCVILGTAHDQISLHVGAGWLDHIQFSIRIFNWFVLILQCKLAMTSIHASLFIGTQ